MGAASGMGCCRARGARPVPSSPPTNRPVGAGRRPEGATRCPAGAWQSVSLLADRPARRQAVALQHPVERPPVDPEDAGRPAHVAPVLVENLADVAPLQLLKR